MCKPVCFTRSVGVKTCNFYLLLCVTTKFQFFQVYCKQACPIHPIQSVWKKDQAFKIEHVKIHSQAKQSWFCWLERVRSLWSVCYWVLLLTLVVTGQAGSSKALPSKSEKVYSHFGTGQCKDSLCDYVCPGLLMSDLSIGTWECN